MSLLCKDKTMAAVICQRNTETDLSGKPLPPKWQSITAKVGDHTYKNHRMMRCIRQTADVRVKTSTNECVLPCKASLLCKPLPVAWILRA